MGLFLFFSVTSAIVVTSPRVELPWRVWKEVCVEMKENREEPKDGTERKQERRGRDFLNQQHLPTRRPKTAADNSPISKTESDIQGAIY
jgi:hypothetical protein